MQDNRDLNLVTEFFTKIGLPWRFAPGAHGFIAGIDIKDGVLLIDPNARASGVLHEGGHLACLPGEYRSWAQSNMSGVQRRMLEHIDFDRDPDGPLQRAAIQCSDPEATAWAWAAGKHLGLAPQSIIQNDEYEGGGDAIRISLQCRAYVGINGLTHAGFCATSEAYGRASGLPVYPNLKYWLQLDFGSLARAKEKAPELSDASVQAISA